MNKIASNANAGRPSFDGGPGTGDAVLRSALRRLPIYHRFALDASGHADSVQCLTVPPGQLALPNDLAPLLPRLGPFYFDRLRRLSGGLIRPQTGVGGVRFDLARLGWSLLSFASPTLEGGPQGGTARYPITGGLLLQDDGERRGSLALSLHRQPDGRVRLCMEVTGYRSRLRGGRLADPVRARLYRWSQAPLHHLIARDYLRALARALQRGTLDGPGAA